MGGSFLDLGSRSASGVAPRGWRLPRSGVAAGRPLWQESKLGATMQAAPKRATATAAAFPLRTPPFGLTGPALALAGPSQHVGQSRVPTTAMTPLPPPPPPAAANRPMPRRPLEVLLQDSTAVPAWVVDEMNRVYRPAPTSSGAQPSEAAAAATAAATATATVAMAKTAAVTAALAAAHGRHVAARTATACAFEGAGQASGRASAASENGSGGSGGGGNGSGAEKGRPIGAMPAVVGSSAAARAAGTAAATATATPVAAGPPLPLPPIPSPAMMARITRTVATSRSGWALTQSLAASVPLSPSPLPPTPSPLRAESLEAKMPPQPLPPPPQQQQKSSQAVSFESAPEPAVLETRVAAIEATVKEWQWRRSQHSRDRVELASLHAELQRLEALDASLAKAAELETTAAVEGGGNDLSGGCGDGGDGGGGGGSSGGRTGGGSSNGSCGGGGTGNSNNSDSGGGSSGGLSRQQMLLRIGELQARLAEWRAWRAEAAPGLSVLWRDMEYHGSGGSLAVTPSA
ncbi:unnamed protein product [Phaeothamnion confervicola]